MATAGFFGVQVIAQLLTIDERRIQQLVKDGWIPQAQRGQYSLVECVHGYIKFLRDRQPGNARSSDHARLSRAQAQRVEMENLRRMGELAAWSQVDEAMQGLVVTMSSALEGLPGRLSSELASIAEPARIYQRLQDEHRNIRVLCADYLEKCAVSLETMPRPGQDDEAGEENDADSLGGAVASDAAGLPGAGSV